MDEQEAAKLIAELRELREQAAVRAAEQEVLRTKLAATVERSAQLLARIQRAERGCKESATQL